MWIFVVIFLVWLGEVDVLFDIKIVICFLLFEFFFEVVIIIFNVEWVIVLFFFYMWEGIVVINCGLFVYLWSLGELL